MVLLREIGFVLINEIIWSKDGTGGKWGSWGQQRPIFGSYPYPPNFLFKNVHEYIIIVSKPPNEAGTVRRLPYAELMESSPPNGPTAPLLTGTEPVLVAQVPRAGPRWVAGPLQHGRWSPVLPRRRG